MADQKAAYFDGRDAELQAAAQRVLDDRNALIADQEKLDEAKQALEARMARIRAAMEE
jgi:primosomal protein N''